MCGVYHGLTQAWVCRMWNQCSFVCTLWGPCTWCRASQSIADQPPPPPTKKRYSLENSRKGRAQKEVVWDQRVSANSPRDGVL